MLLCGSFNNTLTKPRADSFLRSLDNLVHQPDRDQIATMASVQCTSLSTSRVLTERTSSSACSTTSSFQRVPAPFSARTCHSSVSPTSSDLKYGAVERQSSEHFHSIFFHNNTRSPFKTNISPAKKPVGTLIRAQHVSFKATRTVTIPFKEGAFPANEYLKETERIVKVTFPDSTRIEYLGDQKWRSRLRPLTFINVTATPTVEMRVSFEKGYLRLYSNNLFLDFTGVPESFAVADFSFLLDGSMRATLRSPEAVTVRHNSDFAGSVSLGLSTDLPAAFALIPEGIVTRAGDEILDRIIGAMEGALLQGIIRDYNIWCRMKSRKVAKPRQPVVPLRTSTS
ncbi:hypothetical protein M758_2G069300 [Ceratodon purpureus]|nr:hypothetical protein M758_2G069300 [Ceratodon purpureus]